MKWVALFSQTGSELKSVCSQLNKWPDLIITNTKHAVSHLDFPSKCFVKVQGLKYDDKFYNKLIGAFNIEPHECIVTCHGWLRIIPADTCKAYTIYNGHPGDIVRYPELKGKDPQQKAFDSKLTHSGTIIHRVTECVDSGPIVARDTVKIVACKTVDQVIDKLKQQSIKQWINFLPTIL